MCSFGRIHFRLVCPRMVPGMRALGPKLAGRWAASDMCLYPLGAAVVFHSDLAIVSCVACRTCFLLHHFPSVLLGWLVNVCRAGAARLGLNFGAAMQHSMSPVSSALIDTGPALWLTFVSLSLHLMHGCSACCFGCSWCAQAVGAIASVPMHLLLTDRFALPCHSLSLSRGHPAFFRPPFPLSYGLLLLNSLD